LRQCLLLFLVGQRDLLLQYLSHILLRPSDPYFLYLPFLQSAQLLQYLLKILVLLLDQYLLYLLSLQLVLLLQYLSQALVHLSGL
jgi:hypothetical protein